MKNNILPTLDKILLDVNFNISFFKHCRGKLHVMQEKRFSYKQKPNILNCHYIFLELGDPDSIWTKPNSSEYQALFLSSIPIVSLVK